MTLVDQQSTADELRARVSELARRQQELEQQLRGREFRTGDFIWNKLPLGYLAGLVKKWARRLLDLKTRLRLRSSRGKRAPEAVLGKAVVTSTRIWPIYSHTFVYQEMVGLLDMGFDVRLFHWDRGDMGHLHHAFQLLRSRRVQLQHHRGNHERDRRYFERTRPDRLRSFLERISTLSGKTVPQLMDEPIVLQGCTFARLVELSGARYLHSYFFYDQSFMAMMAAWLLDLPRGVSCYADHMLDDYPWKFVPLHIELADVVVATSERIKRELSHLSGGKHDGKILVKPNGVDGTRFPAVERPPRAPGAPFEVLSVSRLEPKKGLPHLVEALAALEQRGHHVVAHVVGSADEHKSGGPEYAGWLRQRIEQLGMQRQIVMHGMLRQEQMGPVIQRCRAFVAPYVETEDGDKDGIPTAMLEAMASGLPVVTTDSGSIPEVIEPDVEGLVVAQRDGIAFADALQRLLDDPALEQRMARAARARFEKDFDIHVTERTLHERIRTILAARA